jgi:hypothetical protein
MTKEFNIAKIYFLEKKNGYNPFFFSRNPAHLPVK